MHKRFAINFAEEKRIKLWESSQKDIDVAKVCEKHDVVSALESFKILTNDKKVKLILKNRKDPYGHVFWLKCKHSFKI